MIAPVLETDRLRLRPPLAQDFEALCALMADEVVTRYIGGVQTPPLAWRALCGIVGHWELRGFGFFSVIEKESGQWLAGAPKSTHRERLEGWMTSLLRPVHNSHVKYGPNVENFFQLSLPLGTCFFNYRCRSARDSKVFGSWLQ